jgi:aldose 1-epimerase
MKLVTLEVQSERAVFAPEWGCQCLNYSVGALEVIERPSSLDALREHTFRHGIPILFPWPGRVANARFSFRGREVTLPVNEPARGHAIHGLAFDRPFAVTRRGPYFLHTELDSRTDSALTGAWPYPFVLELDWEVGNGLRCAAAVHNVGNETMPFGIGAHPYIHAPLDERGRRGEVALEVSASSHWPLDERLIPRGAPEPVTGRFDLRGRRRLGSESYDDAFQLDARRDAGLPCARLIDPALGLAVELRAAPAFRELVAYAPPDREVVSLEPYTCAPDAFNLATRGIDAGVIELAPGATFNASFELRLSAA